MHHRTYVSDIYQWVIDDVVAKLRCDFFRKGIDETVLYELAEEWERRVLEMKICEVPDYMRHVRDPVLNRQKLSEERNIFSARCCLGHSITHNCITQRTPNLGPEQLLCQYRDAVSLVSAHYTKLPLGHVNERGYYNYLCVQYITAIENLQIRIQSKSRSVSGSEIRTIGAITPLDTRLLPQLFPRESYLDEDGTTGTEKVPSSINKKLGNKIERNFLGIWSHGNLADNRDDNQRKSNALRRDLVLPLSKDLDREELSDLSYSDLEELQETANRHSIYKNRIDCCYAKINRRKKGKRTKWQSMLSHGIILVDNKEYVFNEAKADFTWDAVFDGN